MDFGFGRSQIAVRLASNGCPWTSVLDDWSVLYNRMSLPPRNAPLFVQRPDGMSRTRCEVWHHTFLTPLPEWFQEIAESAMVKENQIPCRNSWSFTWEKKSCIPSDALNCLDTVTVGQLQHGCIHRHWCSILCYKFLRVTGKGTQRHQ